MQNYIADVACGCGYFAVFIYNQFAVGCIECTVAVYEERYSAVFICSTYGQVVFCIQYIGINRTGINRFDPCDITFFDLDSADFSVGCSHFAVFIYREVIIGCIEGTVAVYKEWHVPILCHLTYVEIIFGIQCIGINNIGINRIGINRFDPCDITFFVNSNFSIDDGVAILHKNGSAFTIHHCCHS